MRCRSLLLVMCLGLLSCQPKGDLTYKHPSPTDFPINQMIVVVDYLNLRDDVGTYWDFDSYYHQATLDHVYMQIKSLLADSGYPEIFAYLLSSGLLIKADFAVEHYHQEQSQHELLYPPYLLAQENIKPSHIHQHQEFLNIMVKYLAQRRHDHSDPVSMRGMQMGYHFESMDLPDDTGILYVHINQSAAGLMKQLGTLLLTGAIASQADHAYVGIDVSSDKQATAFLVHKGSGQILWKTFSNSWTTNQSIIELFYQFLPKVSTP